MISTVSDRLLSATIFLACSTMLDMSTPITCNKLSINSIHCLSWFKFIRTDPCICSVIEEQEISRRGKTQAKLSTSNLGQTLFKIMVLSELVPTMQSRPKAVLRIRPSLIRIRVLTVLRCCLINCGRYCIV